MRVMLNTKDNDPAFISALLEGTSVTATPIPNAIAEDTVFEGNAEELCTIVWRYVTPIERFNAGDYATEETAGPEEREDFEYFCDLHN